MEGTTIRGIQQIDIKLFIKWKNSFLLLIRVQPVHGQLYLIITDCLLLLSRKNSNNTIPNLVVSNIIRWRYGQARLRLRRKH